MERAPVTSDLVVSAGYDARSGTLEIELTGGRIYQYYQVPATIYEQLMAAESKGKYFNYNIKGAYAYALV